MNVDRTALDLRTMFICGELGRRFTQIGGDLHEAFGGADICDMAGGARVLNPNFASCKDHAGLQCVAIVRNEVPNRLVRANLVAPLCQIYSIARPICLPLATIDQI